jgi:hypothetical protein
MPMAPHALPEPSAVNPVPITDHVSRRIPRAKRLGDLLRDPFGGRMRGHSRPKKLPASMQQDQKPYNSRNEIVGTTNKSIEAMPSA